MVLEYFIEGKKILSKMLWLILFNILLSLLGLNEIVKILAFRGVHYGLKITLPKSIPVLWDFVSLPTKVNVNLLPLPFSLILGYIITVFSSFIIGGYLGVILREAQGAGGEGFLDHSKRYFKEILCYNLLWYTLMVLLVVFAKITIPLLAIPLILLYFIIYYFIYATPFIIVSQNLDFKGALSLSIEVAKKREFLVYTLTYALIVLFLSIPFTILVVNGKIVGIIVGLIASSIPSLWLSASTMLLVINIIKMKYQEAVIL